MINLDQVRTLEWKVKQAVQLIVHLRRENDTLRGRLSDTEVRLQELETLLESFKATQNEMESGIRSALEELDNLDEGVTPDQGSGSVDPLSYPPATPKAADQAFASEDPAGIFEKVSAPVAVQAPVPEVEPSFEEEYAALAAAEAEALASVSFDEAPVAAAEPTFATPESVELEETAVEQDEESLFLEAQVEPEQEPVVPEEKRPEQPGLGIF